MYWLLFANYDTSRYLNCLAAVAIVEQVYGTVTMMIFFVFFYMILKKPTITAASDDPRLLNINSAKDFIRNIRSES